MRGKGISHGAGTIVNAIANGGLTINQSGVVKYTGTSTDMIGNTCAVTINEAGQLDFNGVSDTIANVTIAEDVRNPGQQVIAIMYEERKEDEEDF